jgi:hypothetical protein
MGNRNSTEVSHFPEEILQKEYEAFVEKCCNITPGVYCNYAEFCAVFSIYLQRHHPEYIKYGYTSNKWDALSRDFIHRLYENKTIECYFSSEMNVSLVIGIQVERINGFNNISPASTPAEYTVL